MPNYGNRTGPGFYGDIDGAFILYDLTSRESFENVNYWMEEIRRYSSERVAVILIGNKCDKSNREVSFDEGNDLADSLGISFMETSILNRENLELALLLMVNDLKDKLGHKWGKCSVI